MRPWVLPVLLTLSLGCADDGLREPRKAIAEKPNPKPLPQVPPDETSKKRSQAPVGEPVSLLLDTLVEDYAAYGLSFPPADSRVVRRKLRGGVVNGVQKYNYRLAFLVESGGKRVFWKGCGPDTDQYSRGATIEEVTPDRTALEWTEPSGGNYWPHEFPSHTDLALAIQCYERGWTDLANALLERSDRRQPASVFDHRSLRPKDPRKALADMAWNTWSNRFVQGPENREAVLKRMNALARTDFGLDTQAHKNLIEDMEKTLAPSAATPGTPEALVDLLVDLKAEGYWPGAGHTQWVEHPDKYPPFKKLRDMGLDAVPVLVGHLDDFRLTRSMQTTQGGAYTWHIRIADVVGVLLNGLYVGEEKELTFDFLSTEGRGKRLDDRHVLHWWNETQGAVAADYLIENAVTPGENRDFDVNEAMLHALGKRYPDRLVALVEETIPKVEYLHELLEVLELSAAPDADKIRLYRVAARAPTWKKRHLGIKHPLKAGHPRAVGLLVEELKKIPATPKDGYWLSSAGSIPKLVRYTDDLAAWKTLGETARRVDIGQRLQMIQAIGGGYAPDHPKRKDFLIGLLGDRESRTLPRSGPGDEGLWKGPCAGFTFENLVVGDYAALELAHLLKLGRSADASWGPKEWKELQSRVRKELVARGLLKERDR